MNDRFKIDPVYRLNFHGRELGTFTQAELLKLRNEIDRLFGLEHLVRAELFEIENILDAFCQASGRSRASLIGRGRPEALVFSRNAAISIISELCPTAALDSIGRSLKRCGSLVIHSRQSLRDRTETDPQARAEYQRLRAATIAILNQAKPGQPPNLVAL